MAEASLDTAVLPDREPVYRRNFIFFLADSILFSVAMAIIGQTTLIPDFVRHLTGSEILIGLSGNLFGIFWALPQLFIARYVIGVARKKWWFVGPNIPVRFVMLAFAGIAVWLGKGQPGAILAAFFICYGIAGFGDGLVGVPWADLTGTSIDEKWRARLFGLTTAIVGVMMLGVSRVIGLILGDASLGFPNNYALVFAIAGGLFAVSILPIVFVRELPGGKPVERIPSFREFMPQLGHVLRTDPAFRSMMIAQMLITLFNMAAPFYIGFGTVRLGLSSDVAVPNLLIVQTIGAVAGSFVYAWLAARDNLLFMRLALAGALAIPVCALLAGTFGPTLLYVAFLVSGVTMSNMFLAVQNWVVTHASHDERPIHAGLFNTIVAVISLLAPFIAGTIVQSVSYIPLFIASIVMGCLALFVLVRFVRK